MTDHIAMDALNFYLKGDIDLDALEERVLPLAWDAEFEDQELIGSILIEIAHINDGMLDEAAFRERVAEIAASRRDIVIAV